MIYNRIIILLHEPLLQWEVIKLTGHLTKYKYYEHSQRVGHARSATELWVLYLQGALPTDCFFAEG